MSKTKTASRRSVARSEGIFERVETITEPMLRCTICGRELHPNAIVRASHGKKHVREGKAIARREYDFSMGPRTVFERAP